MEKIVYLADYAVSENNSKGRTIDEKSPKDRNEFQRDYSRIIHSNAWRRLQYKTQVFSNNEGDQFRTRASHSLEVAQVAKTVSRNMGLNEDLAETLAVSHDLGHAPFGHMGQDILNHLMADYGGFEHNMQALRIVDQIENPYPDFSGLNLMFETKEGLLKHYNEKTAQVLGNVADQRFYSSYDHSTLEARIVDTCDSIAYNHADLEDGYQMGILDWDCLMSLNQFKKHWEQESNKLKPDTVQAVKTVSRSMFTTFVENLMINSTQKIKNNKINSLDEVRQTPNLIDFSNYYKINHKSLKRFLSENLYQSKPLLEKREEQKRDLQYVFNSFMKNPHLVLSSEQLKSNQDNIARKVCDYVSGMTDRSVIAHSKHLRRMSIEEKANLDHIEHQPYKINFDNSKSDYSKKRANKI